MAYDKKYKRRHAARRFGRLRLKRGSAAFPESGGILMYQQEYERWLAAELEDKDLKPELLSIQGIDAEIQDRFAVELEFGTAGLRGVLGAGTNRMNIYMVRKATQGLANYLNKQGGKKASPSPTTAASKATCLRGRPRACWQATASRRIFTRS